MQPYGRIALITTPEFRNKRPNDVGDFVYQQLYPLCNHFEVFSTGGTYDFISGIVERKLRKFTKADRAAIGQSTEFPIDNQNDLERWRRTIKTRLKRVDPGIKGMIGLAFELVECRLDAVIHLTDWADVPGKPDSMVLRREANVHNVFIASDIHTARAGVASWVAQITQHRDQRVFPHREPPKDLPLKGIRESDRVFGLIAHDGMKLEICRFIVENVRRIFENYDFVLTTGRTGAWVKKFAIAAGRGPNEVDKKVRCCRSGPYGGDVQIAAAVVKKLCRKVMFLQDPFTSHAHETDIRLFEQSVLSFEGAALSQDIDVELATNVETAKVILGTA